MSFKQFSKDYLNFTTREKSGIAGLLVLIALLYFLPYLLFKNEDYSKELKAFEKEIAAMDTGNAIEPNSEYTNYDYQKTEPFEPFYFDPNTVDPQQLAKFRVPQYVIKSFTKYRNAGARFYQKEDLKKLYGLKPNVYERMAPYIKIEEKYTSNFYPKNEYKKPELETVKVELNMADSLTLLKVKGIGPYLSSKIIKYRDALGGYVKMEQLYEIFNIKPEQVEAFAPYVFIDKGHIKRLNVNTAEFYLLNWHPYISSKEANAIINYRKQHGLYKSRSDLEKVILLNKEMIDKIEPYLEY